jgi:hypothetical protein
VEVFGGTGIQCDDLRGRVIDRPEKGQRRATLILNILKGETSAQAAARKHGLTVAEVEEWRDRFLVGAENALRATPQGPRPLSWTRRHRSRPLLVGSVVRPVVVLPALLLPTAGRRAAGAGHRGGASANPTGTYAFCVRVGFGSQWWPRGIRRIRSAYSRGGILHSRWLIADVPRGAERCG